MGLNLSTTWIYYLSLAIWLLSALKGIALYTYYWQLKEYRWDRMWDFLNSPKGKSLIFSPLNATKLIISLMIVGAFLKSASQNLAWLTVGALIFLGIIRIVGLVRNFFNHNFFRPKTTFRMLLLLLATFTIEGLMILFTPALTLTVLILEIVRPLLITILMHIIGIPFWILKKYLIFRATKKRQQLSKEALKNDEMRGDEEPLTEPYYLYGEGRGDEVDEAVRVFQSFPNLKVIGITGSYGKSSTKEFLYQILQHKFKTVKTPKHINVDIGIAQTLLKQVDSSIEVFIVEIGAYKIGEIASSCRIVRPQIGILTGVNEQHLSFFGCIENTIHAKGELLASLPENGLAIVNADSANALESLKKCNKAKRVIQYSTQGHADLFADDIKQKDSSLNFKVHHKNEIADFSFSVFGEHFVQNLLACIACALELGLNLKEISEYAKSCQVLDGNMRIFKNSQKVQIIDDSYNSNPDGFISALDALKNLNAHRKIVVTMGMIELGQKSNELHQHIGQKIAGVADTIFVTSNDAFEALVFGIKRSNPKVEIFLITDFKELIQKISEKIASGDAILFENRVPVSVINHFKKA